MKIEDEDVIIIDGLTALMFCSVLFCSGLIGYMVFA